MNLAEREARLERLRGYLVRDPGNLPLTLDFAATATEVGRGEEALQVLDRALEGLPNEPRLLGARGNVLLALSRLDEAALLFEGLIAQVGAQPELSFNLAMARIYQGRGREARELLEGIAPAARASLPQFELHCAQAAYQTLDYAGALAGVDRYLRTNPGDVDGASLRALLLLDTEREALAASEAQALLKVDPRRWEAHLVLGSCALATQDAGAAEAHFSQALSRAPDLGRAWSGRGFAALLRRDVPLARRYFEKAVEQMKDHPGTWHGLVWSCILLGDLARARSALESSMEVDRNFADNHGTLAVLEVLAGRHTEAELSIRKALRLNPQAPSALYARSLLLDAKGDAAGADAIVEKILGSGMAQGPALLALYKQGRSKSNGGLQPPTIH